MKTLTFPQLLFAALGALLIYAAITNQSPLAVLSLGLAKGPLPGVTKPGAVKLPNDGNTPMGGGGQQ